MGSQEQSGGQPRFTSPLSISRSPSAERRRNSTSDNRWGVYVAPISPTEHWVKNAGDAQIYRVGSAGPVVFKAGQAVLLASSGGIGGEIILGYPGANKKGGSSSSSRSRATHYSGGVAPTEILFYAFYVLEDQVVASIVNDSGEIVSSRGSTAGEPSGQLSPITIDSAGNVGDGSVAWARWPGGISSWDVESNTVYEWDSSPTADGVSPPIYLDGYLWWWTVKINSASSTTATLRRARTDLTSQSAIAAIGLTMLPNIASFDSVSAVRFVMSSISAAVTFGYTDPNPDGTWPAAYSCDLTGANQSSFSDGDKVEVDGIGFPIGESGAVAIDGEALSSVEIALGSIPVALWSEDGAWALDVPSTVGVAVDAASAVVVDGSGRAVYGSLSPAVDDPPIAAFDIDGGNESFVLVPIPTGG